MKRSYKILFTVFVFVIGIFSTQKLLKKYQTYSKFISFLNNKDCDYDVFFLGTSHVLNGIYPMDLWNDFGITSYNFAWHSTPIATNYYLLKMAEKKNKPKIVFIDILQLQEDIKYNVYIHQLFDYFPLDEIKYEAVNDFLPGKNNFIKRMEFYFPFIYCHNTWLDLKANNFHKELPTKGADLRIGVKVPQEFGLTVPEYTGKESTGIEYSKKIISFCKENGIIPVFCLIPYPVQYYLNDWKKELINILDNENIVFLEFPEDIVDFDTDMYDLNSHLNPSGAKKVTRFIGEYISKNYDGLCKKTDLQINNWNADYKRYFDYCVQKLNEQQDMTAYLMMLYNKEYYSEIYMGKTFVPSKIENKLIEQIPAKKIVSEQNDFRIHVKVYKSIDNELISEKYF